MASAWFRKGITDLVGGNLDIDGTTSHPIRAELVTSQNIDFSTAVYLSNVTRTDAGNNVDVPDAMRVSSTAFEFGAAAGTLAFTTVTADAIAKGIVIYHSADEDAAACPLIVYDEFSGSVTADGGTMTITLDGDGWGKATY